MSPRQTHSEQKALFGTLDEHFNKTKNGAATKFDEDYLKVKGLKSVTVAEPKWLIGFFSS